LENNPGIFGEIPKPGVNLSPHFIGRMIPGPAHIESQFGKRIESLDFGREKGIQGAADFPRFVHVLSLH
jgi:hypothetical protein